MKKRQVGKTTLARSLLAPGSSNWFDLEDPQVEAQLASPLVALKDLRGLVVIDEIQHAPDLFKVLRVLGRRIGVEFKRSDAPELTPSMRIALDDLSLDALYVVYHGDRRCVLAPRVQVVPLTSLLPASTTA